MTTMTAPEGRVYWFGSKNDPRGRQPAEVVDVGRKRYAEAEGRAPTWLRCHPSQEDLFVRYWPAALPDPRVQRGTIMLGVES